MEKRHTLQAFEQALSDLSAAVLIMTEHVQAMVASAAHVLLDNDLVRAGEVVENDLVVDRELETIRARCLDILVRYQPVAGDLRQVIAIEHSAGNLERAADHAKNIAKRAIADRNSRISADAAELFRQLHAAVLGALEDANDALVRRDVDLAHKVVRGDSRIDVLHDDLFHLVLAGSRRDTSKLKSDIHLLFAAKSLERIGDHATNIAEEVIFMSRREAPDGSIDT